MAEDDRPEGGRRGRVGLEASRTYQPVVREETYALRNVRRGGCELLVVVQIDPEHTRRFHCAEAAGIEHSERDRHLAENVTRLPLTDDALHPVDAPDHLDPTFEEAEERPLVTLVHGGLAWRERDICDHPGQPVTFGRLEVREHTDPTDLLRRHHEMHHRRRLSSVRWSTAGALDTTKRCSRPVPLKTRRRYCTAFVCASASA